MKGAKSKAPTRQEMLEALGSYQKRGSLSYEVRDMAALLVNESDRGVVVILGSLLEDVLLERLTKSFITMNITQAKNLTRGGGLLNSFDHKITLGHSLGIIDQDMVEMLQVVKAMRNACAHSRQDIGFSTAELRDALSLLFTEPNAWAIRTSKTEIGLRFMFIVAFVYISTILLGKGSDVAARKSQFLMDELLIQSTIEVEKQRALREKQKSRPKPRPRPAPKGKKPPRPRQA